MLTEVLSTYIEEIIYPNTRRQINYYNIYTTLLAIYKYSFLFLFVSIIFNCFRLPILHSLAL